MNVLHAKQVLVVDDNPGDIGLFHQLFEEIDGVVCHAVMSVIQANAFLAKKSPFEAMPTPDLVFLDLRLPIFSGHGLLKTIRENPKLSHVRVVVFTSSDHEDDKRRCRELGADDYIVKPYDWPQWKATIAAVLARQCGVIEDDSEWGCPR
jgi:CheY-like chemotaxis protein